MLSRWLLSLLGQQGDDVVVVVVVDVVVVVVVVVVVDDRWCFVSCRSPGFGGKGLKIKKHQLGNIIKTGGTTMNLSKYLCAKNEHVDTCQKGRIWCPA